MIKSFGLTNRSNIIKKISDPVFFTFFFNHKQDFSGKIILPNKIIALLSYIEAVNSLYEIISGVRFLF